MIRISGENFQVQAVLNFQLFSNGEFEEKNKQEVKRKTGQEKTNLSGGYFLKPTHRSEKAKSKLIKKEK